MMRKQGTGGGRGGWELQLQKSLQSHQRLWPMTWQPWQVVSEDSHFNQHFLKKPQPGRWQRNFLTGVKWCHRCQSCKSPPWVHQVALSHVLDLVFVVSDLVSDMSDLVFDVSDLVFDMSDLVSDVSEGTMFVGSMVGEFSFTSLQTGANICLVESWLDFDFFALLILHLCMVCVNNVNPTKTFNVKVIGPGGSS